MGKFITSVRFKVKEGKSEEFVKKSKEIGKYEQAIDNFTFQTGEDTFCFVGIFENEQAIIEARPHMISNLAFFALCHPTEKAPKSLSEKDKTTISAGVCCRSTGYNW